MTDPRRTQQPWPSGEFSLKHNASVIWVGGQPGRHITIDDEHTRTAPSSLFLFEVSSRRLSSAQNAG